MLYDAVETERVVDREASLEFMKEATKLASTTELEDIGQRLEGKSRRFRHALSPEGLAELDETGFCRLTAAIFSLRRKGKRLIKANGLETLKRELERLVHGAEPLNGRFERFTGSISGVEPAMAVSLASECLHFADPARYWLWTHWIWNPRTGTGALRLVTREGVDIDGSSDGEVYEKVGRAMALVDAEGHAVGWARSGPGLFGTDVFLASVYAVYMYTVFRVKLSQEFNRILPELPELVERVLGVHRGKDPVDRP